MTEQFSNMARSTLASGIDADDTSLTVASGASFPSLSEGDDFKIRIDNEIMQVTARSGTGGVTFAVVRGYEGSTATNHTSGSIVRHVLTAGSLIEAIDEHSAEANELADVATSGDYDDLLNKPVLADVATSGDYEDLDNRPSLHAVATSGDYNDLSNKPSAPDLSSLVTLSPNSDTRNVIQPSDAAVKPLVIKGASGQSDWLTLWQNNSNTTLVYITASGQIASALSTGTAPFSVNSTTKVTNLNADLIDGYSSGDFVLITSPYANLQQYDNGNVSGSFAYNYANGRQQTAKLTGTTALSITNGGNCSAPAVLIIDNTDNQSLSFSGSFKWAGGTEPSLGTGIHVLILIYDNKSSSYLCNVSQSYS